MKPLTASVCSPPLVFPVPLPIKPKTSNSQADFWPIWLQHQDYLSQRCLQWMGGNRTNAEEALSNAMLKARAKWPQYADKITNPKAWLTRLTHNLCVDLHRARSRQPVAVDNFEEVMTDATPLANVSSPKENLLRQELNTYLHQIIEELPPRLRQTVILKFLQEISYKEIAQQLSISEDNVYKRIQEARAILRKKLKKYLAGHSKKAVVVSKFAPESTPQPLSKTFHCSFSKQSTHPTSISYEVSATCLEILPHAWYQSPMPVVWH
ncbi:MAG: RNA polymerase sigma factor [Leptolyngbya sp. SIO3F4]|nr:RNA polymerase sigma factor [Leptolyngbya sp. SIO3F4]